MWPPYEVDLGEGEVVIVCIVILLGSTRMYSIITPMHADWHEVSSQCHDAFVERTHWRFIC